jgi:thiol reductant ABC exporter CydC subunit
VTPLVRAAALVAPRRGRLALSVVLGAGAVAAAIGLLATSGYLIVRAAQRPPILELTVAIVAVRAFGIGRALLRYGERLVAHDLAFRVLADLRGRFYARLAPLVPAGLPRLRAGDLLSRFVADVDQLQHLYLRAIAPPAVAVAVIALACGIAFAILPAAALVLGALLLVAATVVPAVTHLAARAAAGRQGPARAALSSELVEALDGAAELAVLGQDRARLARVRAADAGLARLVRRDALAGGLATGLGTLLPGVATVAVVAVAIPAVGDGRITGPQLGLLALLALASFEAVAPLPAAAQQLAACARSAARLEAVVDAPVPVADPVRPAPLPRGAEVAAENVVVAFERGAAPVLDGVDLRVAPGRAVALVGASGSGKTTLAELLVRFRDPDAGRVTLGGADVRTLAQDGLRRTVLLASQDAHLFTTSIRENLLLARRDATDGDLRAALAAVGLGAFVAALPDGLDTQVGQDGAQLSGGQRRRLLVARALVSDARVLLLDEPAAHLDPPAARALHERLVAESARRGVLVIAHTVAGLERCDEIAVLHGGRIAERGTHAELLAGGGCYAAMARAQGAADPLATR